MIRGYDDFKIDLGERLAKSIFERKTRFDDKWTYEYGVMYKAFEALWLDTNKEEYFNFIKSNVDKLIDEDGKIKGYNLQEFNIDHVNNGKTLITLYKKTGENKYRIAIETLRNQLRKQPRTTEGLYWHKKIYPYQVWLDGIFMGDLFYAEYIKEFGDKEEFDDVVKQFVLTYNHTVDKATGLMYHAYDEKRVQSWCDKNTGLSKNFWGRAMGWYFFAIVDLLDYLPCNHKDRHKIIKIINNLAVSIMKVRDKESFVWYQVLDKGDKKGNYYESSCTAMFIYAMAKAVRLGYISREYKEEVIKSYKGAIEEFIARIDSGVLNYNKTVRVSGLSDSRDGSFAYYISEPIYSNDPKGLGAFISACIEVKKLFN